LLCKIEQPRIFITNDRNDYSAEVINLELELGAVQVAMIVKFSAPTFLEPMLVKNMYDERKKSRRGAIYIKYLYIRITGYQDSE
jgi:hypothetical protein